MKCDRKKEQLAAWLLGNLSSAAADEVSAHINTCFRCSQTVAQLKLSLNQLQQHEISTAPVGLKQRIMVQAREKIQDKQYKWQIWQLGIVGSAVMIFLVLSILFFYPQPQWHQQELEQAYKQDFKALGLYFEQYETDSKGDTIELFGVPTELMSYLN